MHKRRHFAFTLVELLVVIAILAILATVSVVGYLGFTERAHISNDTTLAAQLDTLVKAEDVNNPITSEDDLLKLYEKTFGESMSTLEPESAKYGYHFWYNINEKSVILSKSKDLSNNQSLVTTLANNENQFSDSLREELVDGYYLMDGKGSALADVLTLSDDLKNKEQYVSLLNNIEKVKKDETEPIYNKLNNVNNNTAYVTDEGTFRKVNNPSNVKVSKSLTKTVAAMYTYKEETTTTFSSLFKAKELTVDNLEESFISEENPIATLSNNEVIKFPASITSIGTNSMFFNIEGHAHLLLDGKVEDAIKTTIRRHATNLVFMVDGHQYKFENNDDVNLYEVDEELNKVIPENRIPVAESDIVVDNFDLYVNTTKMETADYYDLIVNKTASVTIDNIQGIVGGKLPNSYVNYQIEPSEYASVNDEGVITFNGVGSATLKVSTQFGGEKTININIGGIDTIYGFTAETANKINDGEIEEFNIEYSENKEVNFNYEVSYKYANRQEDWDLLNKNIEITTSSDEVTFDLKSKKMKVNNVTENPVIVTFNVKDHPSYIPYSFKINVTVEIEKMLDIKFENKDKYVYKIGNQNDFSLAYIYEVKDEYKDKIIVEPHFYHIEVTGDNQKVDILEDHSKNIYLTHIDGLKYRIHGTGYFFIELEVKMNGVSVYTEKIVLEATNALNVTSISEFKSNSNLVLLSNISVNSGETTTYSFKDNKIVGNGFKLDAAGYGKAVKTKGLINLNNSIMDNIIIIGRDFDGVHLYADEDHISVINVSGGTCYISNSYIQGFRAPIVVTVAEKLYIDNTTLSGGSMANMTVESAVELSLKDVKTIQYINSQNAYGVGIFFGLDTVKSSKVNIQGSLEQYNYAGSDEIKTLDSNYQTIANEIKAKEYLNPISFTYGGDKKIHLGLLFFGQKTDASGEFVNIVNSSLSNYISLPLEETYMGQSFKGSVYCLDQQKNSADYMSDKVLNAKNHLYNSNTEEKYSSNKQDIEKPSIGLIFRDSIPNKDDKTIYRYLEDDVLHIGVLSNGEGTYTITNESFDINISKHGKDIDYVLKYNEINLDEGGIKIDQYSKDGVLEIVYYDNYIFNPDGSMLGDRIKYIYSIKVKVEDPALPAPEITFTSDALSPLYFDKIGNLFDPDYAESIPVFKGMVIKEYERINNEYVKKDTIFNGNYYPKSLEEIEEYGLTISFSGSPYFVTPQYKTKNNIFYIVGSYYRNNKEDINITVTYTYNVEGQKSSTATKAVSFSKGTGWFGKGSTPDTQLDDYHPSI
ncbi:MAG: type II secretion system protein [Bacilli bacterium]|nr:type II secretion system protein [Bacilli bacterium]